MKPGDYDGIVTVSGDGLIHEVVNGLYRRSDSMQLMSSITLGFIPGGSANGLVKAVLHRSGEEVFSDHNILYSIHWKQLHLLWQRAGKLKWILRRSKLSTKKKRSTLSFVYFGEYWLIAISTLRSLDAWDLLALLYGESTE